MYTKTVLYLVLGLFVASCAKKSSHSEPVLTTPTQETIKAFDDQSAGKFEALSKAQMTELNLKPTDFEVDTSSEAITLDSRVKAGNTQKTAYYRQDFNSKLLQISHYITTVTAREVDSITQSFAGVVQLTGLTPFNVTGIEKVTLTDPAQLEPSFENLEFKINGASEAQVADIKSKIAKCRIPSKGMKAEDQATFGFYTLQNGVKVKATRRLYTRTGTAICGKETEFPNALQTINVIETPEMTDLDWPVTHSQTQLHYFTEVSAEGKVLYRSKLERLE